jgi:hypothetical protein
MRVRFDAALKALGLQPDYQFIDADTLAESDARGGYGTPTVLGDGRDLFDMPEPSVPHPPATWRLYPDGVPSTEAIEAKLKLVLRQSAAGTDWPQ